jgi:hypothetical protein
VLSKPSFDDRSLAEFFYGSLLRHFYNSFNSSTQALLEECRFGIAPSPTGVKTFFIVAPSMGVAEQLMERQHSQASFPTGGWSRADGEERHSPRQ